MQSTGEIRRHISAVAETRKITSAMELVSSARIKRAMQHLEYNRKYLQSVQAAMKDILLSPHEVSHPYLRTGLLGTRTYIVIAGDKGMVGSFNSDILNFAAEKIDEDPDGEYILVTVGIMAEQFFRRRGREPDLVLGGLSQDPSLFNARILVNEVIDRFDTKLSRSVYLIYSDFEPGGTAKPTMHRILPIRPHDYEDVESNEPAHEIIYHPSPNEVFRQLVPQYLVGIVFGALVSSFAGEHFARMNTMHSATENADELLSKLGLQYNIARQTAITREIAEITGAAEAINGR